MERLFKVLDNALKLDIDKLMQEVYSDKELQEFILDLNRRRQLFQRGIDSKGSKLGVYAPLTEKLSEGITFSFQGEGKTKVAGGDIFLFDTGDFYESFKIVIEKTAIEITADPQKEDTNLFDKYGPDIVGLTEDSIAILQAIVRERLIPLIRASLIS